MTAYPEVILPVGALAQRLAAVPLGGPEVPLRERTAVFLCLRRDLLTPPQLIA
jgi:hypothetical protein